jgi:hypothetical protein
MKMTEQHIALALSGAAADPWPWRDDVLFDRVADAAMGGERARVCALNHIEEAFGNLFGLKGQPEEYLEFDTAALLRSA